ncbi:MAG: histidinol-phosphate transaminase [Tissierellia bacterium]|nr:histidinol-phosphate transaminase [Tissierellia bacterium]
MSRFLHARWQRLVPYVPGEQPTEKYIKLNTNESPYPPSPRVARLLREEADRLSDTQRLYPDPDAGELRAALKKAYPVKGDFFIGNGSDEVLATLFMAYGQNGRVYYPAISYGFYSVYADVYDCDAVEIPLKDLHVCPEDYQNNDGLIVIANPNAPTGLALTLDEIAAILSANPDHPVVIDEAYVDFGAHSALPLLEKYENLIVVQTFSKSRSLAGLRFGFAAARTEITEDLNRLQFARNPYSVGRLTAKIAIACLEDIAYFADCCAKIQNTRKETKDALTQRGFSCTDSLANFLWARPGDLPAAAYFEKLREKKILVRFFPKDGWNDRLRITIGTPEQMRALLQAIEAIQKEQV